MYIYKKCNELLLVVDQRGYIQETKITLFRCSFFFKSVGVALTLSVGGAGSPSNTTWPEPRTTSVLSGTLIHPTVWPQYINATERQTGQDIGPIA